MKLDRRSISARVFLRGIILFLLFGSIFLIVSPSSFSKEAPRKKSLNLNSEPRYYPFVGYSSSLRLDSSLLLTLEDKRPQQEKVYREEVQWFDDEIWTEPPQKMMQKLFLKELRTSSMFKEVDLVEKGQPFILTIDLISLIGHYDERSRVAKGLLRIHALLKSVSNNRTLLDKDYEQTSSYRVHRFASGYKHIFYHVGKATQTLVEEFMAELEQTLTKETRK